MTRCRSILPLLGLLIWLGLTASIQGQVPRAIADKLRAYETPYYIIHTDLEPDQVQEAIIRTTRMAEEYLNRTRDFRGRINRKLPFYLFKERADYVAASGIPGSAGIYNGRALMAHAGAKLDDRTWRIVQHEGFHQFAREVIGGDLPIWVNEGLAEYFGESIFTGDRLISGVIHPARLRRIKERIQKNEFKPAREMMFLPHAVWSAELSVVNYDHAWSMVHFLMHGEDHRYQAAFVRFMLALNRRVQWERAWRDSFGAIEGFEEKWKAWWLSLPDHPTQEIYTMAGVAALTNYLARAAVDRKTFESSTAFLSAAAAGQIVGDPRDALPASLYADALRWLPRDLPNHLQLVELPSRQWALALNRSDQPRLVGTYQLAGTRVQQVMVEPDDLPRILTEAQGLLEAGKKLEARALVTKGLNESPRSLAAAEARKFLLDTR